MPSINIIFTQSDNFVSLSLPLSFAIHSPFHSIEGLHEQGMAIHLNVYP